MAHTFADLYDRSLSVKFVACGTHHNAVLTNENIMYSWGSNKYGCLGAEIDDEYTPYPQRVRVAAPCCALRDVLLLQYSTLHLCRCGPLT